MRLFFEVIQSADKEDNDYMKATNLTLKPQNHFLRIHGTVAQQVTVFSNPSPDHPIPLIVIFRNFSILYGN
jgi:hypothetical protein